MRKGRSASQDLLWLAAENPHSLSRPLLGEVLNHVVSVFLRRKPRGPMKRFPILLNNVNWQPQPSRLSRRKERIIPMLWHQTEKRVCENEENTVLHASKKLLPVVAGTFRCEITFNRNKQTKVGGHQTQLFRVCGIKISRIKSECFPG